MDPLPLTSENIKKLGNGPQITRGSRSKIAAIFTWIPLGPWTVLPIDMSSVLRWTPPRGPLCYRPEKRRHDYSAGPGARKALSVA